MRIALVGYMGSGKSTVGKLLAEKLQLPFVDLDHLIEQKEQHSISELFTVKGEEYFRMRESNELRTILSNSSAFVLATGGGTPCFNDNMKLLNDTCTTFYLNCDVEVLFDRNTHSVGTRPLFSANISALSEHLSTRISYYEKAHYTIENNSSAEAICDSILKIVTS